MCQCRWHRSNMPVIGRARQVGTDPGRPDRHIRDLIMHKQFVDSCSAIDVQFNFVTPRKSDHFSRSLLLSAVGTSIIIIIDYTPPGRGGEQSADKTTAAIIDIDASADSCTL